MKVQKAYKARPMKIQNAYEPIPMSFRYPLQERETAPGFLSRLAAVNGRTMYEFMRDMCIRYKEMHHGHESQLRKVAFLGRADLTRLVRYTPVMISKTHYRVAGELLTHRTVTRSYFRYCPRCVMEDLRAFDGPLHSRPWLRLEWTIPRFRSCLIHGIFLCDARPRKKENTHHVDFNDMMRQIIPSLNQTSDEAVAAPASPFETWLLGRLSGIGSEPNWLDDVPLYAATAFCEAVGLSSIHPRRRYHTKVTEREMIPIADEGFGILSAGADSLRSLLSRLNGDQQLLRGVWGPTGTYGNAYYVLQNTLHDPGYAKFRDIVRDFAMRTLPIAPGSDVLGVIAGERKVHTIRTVQKETGMHARSIRRVFQRLGVDGAEDESRTKDHRVLAPDTEDFQSVVKELKDAITRPLVMKMLGVPRVHLDDLISHGHLRTVASSNLPNNWRFFSPKDVEDFRTRWFDGAVEVSEPTPKQMNVIAARKKAVCPINQLIEFVLSGRLTWKGRLAGRNDYTDLLVDVDELTRIVRSDSTRTTLTREEAAAAVPGMTLKAVTRLIERGYLPTVAEFNPDARRMMQGISVEDLLEFKTRYVTLGELCTIHDMHFKHAMSYLKQGGIEPAFPMEEVSILFYDRERVDGLERETPNGWAAYNAERKRLARKPPKHRQQAS